MTIKMGIGNVSLVKSKINCADSFRFRKTMMEKGISKNTAISSHVFAMSSLSAVGLSSQFLAPIFNISNPVVDLTGMDLKGVNLSNLDLSWANLIGADLRGADLYRAILEGADLTRVNLYRAILEMADLRWVDLTGVDLTEADLEGAILEGAILEGARIDSKFRELLKESGCLNFDMIDFVDPQ